MTHQFREVSIAIAAVVVLSWAASACSGASSPESVGAVGTSGEGAFVDVELTSFSLGVENRAGMTLNDVRIGITPFGGYTTFTKEIARLDVGQKREMTLSEFRGRDGTQFNLRVVRPKEISVTAVDMSGQKHDLVIPWKK
jgi:hypothetical protein